MGTSDLEPRRIEVVCNLGSHYLQLTSGRGMGESESSGTEPLTCEVYADSGQLVSELS